MAFGVILGAYLMQRDGWAMVWVAVAVAVIAGAVDMIWGREIGLWLGAAVRNLLT